MQIPEKLRAEIALSLPSVGLAEAKEIASQCGCSHDTVYRTWRVIHGRAKGTLDDQNQVVIALAELAVKRKREMSRNKKKLAKTMEQLSATR